MAANTFDDAVARDARRTAYLESQGFRVLRFTNREVKLEIDSVLDTIFAARSLLAPPTPDPSPRGGGEMEPFMANACDILIIGADPGGYVAAIRAAQRPDASPPGKPV